jgi:hypothetical protein
MTRFNSISDVLERAAAPFDGEPGDWHDVLSRARETPPGREPRRHVVRTLLLGAAVVVAVLALAPPFGIASRIVGLFRDEGKPVPVSSLSRLDRAGLASMCREVKLVTPPGRAPEQRCVGGPPRVEEIANNGTRIYWKVTYPKSQVTYPGSETCLASGRVRGYRDSFGRGRSRVGLMGCGPNALPTPKRPITVDASIGFNRGDRHARLEGVSGLAGEGVVEVGLIEKNGDSLKKSVRGRTYDFGRPPDRAWIAIAAFDGSGKEVYRERLHLPGPLPRMRPRNGTTTPERQPPPPLPRGAPVQRGMENGTKIAVYRNGIVAVDLSSAPSRVYRLLQPRGTDPRVPISCSKAAFGAGRWEQVGVGAYGYFGRTMRTSIASPGGGTSPPFDECHLSGRYGRRWNDARGMHDAVEFEFTPLAYRYFAEQAAARDLALFVRTPQIRAVRETMKQGLPLARGGEIARRFPSRVVGLAQRSEDAPPSTIGIWTNRKDLLVVSRRAEDGRHMYVTIREGGRLGPNNLAGLAFVFY